MKSELHCSPHGQRRLTAFIYGLFNEDLSGLVCTILNRRMMNE
jgi:hypothetical protein